MNKYLIALCALMGTLVAQCDNIEIASQGDVDKFTDCTKAKALSISGDKTQQVKLPNLAELETVQISSTQNLISFAIPNVQSLESINVSNNVQLSTVDLGSLNKVNNLAFSNNPNLGTVILGNITSLKNFDFTNNAITSMTGIDISNADRLTFSGNGNLTKISFDSLQKLNNYLFVSGNHPTLSASFPKLSSIGGNCTIANLTSIDFSSLNTVNKEINLASNSASNITLPELKKSGSFSFVSNTNAKSLFLPQLETITGGFLVANNTNLNAINCPELKTISGALDLTGNLDSIQLPQIQTISGTYNIQTKNANFDCNKVKNIGTAAAKASKTSLGCKAGVADPKPSGVAGSDSSNGFMLSAPNSAVALASVLLAGLFM